jgi:glucosyl-dolichyl phosphate glucuronosyltransferase
VIQTANSISVIICAFTEERWDALVAAVESVQQQALSPGEIIVVIDHNMHLLERVGTYLPGVIIIENSGPRGLSGARNSGIAIAQGALVAFLDDDASAEPDWLVQLSRCCMDPRVLGTGGAVTPLWMDKSPAWLPEEFYWVVGCSYRGMPQTIQTIRNPIGANMAFRREVFETVGGFRSGIGRVGTWPVGCEETELCIRARQHWPGRTFLYQPQANVFHRVPSNRTSWRYFSARCYAEGLSKAFITRYVGVRDSLASERTYTLRTLPRGIVRGLMDVLLQRDLAGLARGGAILVGLVLTATGYLVGSALLKGMKLKNIISREQSCIHTPEVSPSVKTEP